MVGAGEQVVHTGTPGVGEARDDAGGGDGAVHDHMVAGPQEAREFGVGENPPVERVVELLAAQATAEVGEAVSDIPFQKEAGNFNGLARGVVDETRGRGFVVGIGERAVTGLEAVAGEVVGLGLGLAGSGVIGPGEAAEGVVGVVFDADVAANVLHDVGGAAKGVEQVLEVGEDGAGGVAAGDAGEAV